MHGGDRGSLYAAGIHHPPRHFSHYFIHTCSKITKNRRNANETIRILQPIRYNGRTSKKK